MYDPRPHTYQRIGRQFAGFMAGLAAGARDQHMADARRCKREGCVISAAVSVAAARRAHRQFLKAVREIP